MPTGSRFQVHLCGKDISIRRIDSLFFLQTYQANPDKHINLKNDIQDDYIDAQKLYDKSCKKKIYSFLSLF